MAEIKKTDIIDSGINQEVDNITASFTKLISEIDGVVLAGTKLNQSLKSTEATQKNVNAANDKANKNAGKLKEATIKLTNLQTNYTKSLVSLNKQKEKATRLTKGEQIALESAKGSYNKINESLKKNIAEYNKLSAAQRKNKKVGGALLGTIKKEDAALKKMDKTMGKSQRHVGNYSRAMGGLKALMGAAGVVGGLMMFVSVLKSSVKTVMEFSRENSKLAAILEVTKNQTTKLSDQAKELGAATQYTATEVTKLQVEYAKLGFTQDQIVSLTGATLDLATAAGTELNNAASIVGGTLRAFGLDAGNAGMLTDVMAKAFSSSALDIEKFKTAMATAGPVAKNAGVSIQQATAQIGTLTNANIDASTAGTSLRNIYLELAKSGMTYDEAMKKIQTSTNKNATALGLFGKRGATAAIVLAETTTETDQLTAALYNSEGAAKTMAQVMQDNLTGDMAKLKSAWDGLILSMDDGTGGMSGFSRAVVQGLTTALNAVQDFGHKFQMWFSKMMESSGTFRASIQILVGSFKIAMLGMMMPLQNLYYLLKATVVSAMALGDGDFSGAKKAWTDMYDSMAKSANKFTNTISETIKKVKHAKSDAAAEEYKEQQKRLKAEQDYRDEQKKSLALEKQRAAEAAKSAAASAEKPKKAKGTPKTITPKPKELDPAKAAALEIKSIDDVNKAFVNSQNEQINAEKQKYLNGEISAKDYANKIIDINNGTAEHQIGVLEEMLNVEGISADETLKIQKQITDAKAAMLDKEVQDKKKAEAKKKKIAADTKKTEADLANAAFDLYHNLMDRQLSNLQTQKEYELSLVGNNEEAKNKINDKFAKKAADIKRKQAIADKAQSLFNIAINTAVAVTSALELGPVGIPLAVLMGALGAAQAAVVLAEPLPKFKHGVKDFEGGNAIVGDGGKRELVVSDSGAWLSPPTDTLVDLPKGADVFSGENTARILGSLSVPQKKKSESQNLEYLELKSIRKALEKGERINVNIDKRGVSTIYGATQQRINRIDKYFN